MWAQLEWEVLMEADCGALCLSVSLGSALGFQCERAVGVLLAELPDEAAE